MMLARTCRVVTRCHARYNMGATSHSPMSGTPTLTPLEVQVNDTLWIPVAINDQGPQGMPTNWNCGYNKDGTPECINGSRAIGWNSVTANVPIRLPLGCVGDPWDLERTGCKEGHPGCVNCTHSLGITGVRYAWSESPCCPNWGSISTMPCPPNSCPITTWNSTLPAVPFLARVVMDNNTDASYGKCQCYAPQECDA